MITASCKTCQMLDANSGYHGHSFPTHQARYSLPGIDWQLDFPHMPTVRCVKYLLVLVDLFSGWMEHFPPLTRGLTQSLTSFSRRLSLNLKFQPLFSQTTVLYSPVRSLKLYLNPSMSFGIFISHTNSIPQER